MAKRKREVVVRFHVTEQERSLIDEKMAMAGIRNRESYLRKMSLGGYVLKIYTRSNGRKIRCYNISDCGI